MKQDKMAEPGLYIQFFKSGGVPTFEVAAWIREDYMVKWTRPSHETWHTLQWNIGPRKNWEKKTAMTTKKDDTYWWEKFDDLASLRQRAADCHHIVNAGEELGEIPELIVDEKNNS